LINHVGNRNHWLGLRLVGSAGADKIGARVQIIRGSATLLRRARSDGSYASANDPRVLVGLGTSTETPRVRIVWPDGQTQEWPSLALDTWHTLKQESSK
jgi:hypothetical protein